MKPSISASHTPAKFIFTASFQEIIFSQVRLGSISGLPFDLLVGQDEVVLLFILTVAVVC